MDKIVRMKEDMDRMTNMLTNFKVNLDLNMDMGLDELLNDFELELGVTPSGNNDRGRGGRGRGASRGNRGRGGRGKKANQNYPSNNNKQRQPVSQRQVAKNKPIVAQLWEPVFDRLTMKQLFCYRLVCKGWLQLIDKVLAKKRSIKMALIPRDIKPELLNEAWNRHCRTAAQKATYIRTNGGIRDCYYLVKMFPSITQLEVLFLFPFDVTPFLKSWTANLTSLTLREVSRSVSLDILWSTLDSLTALQALHLFHMSSIAIPESIPILAQLEEFTLIGHKGDIMPVLNGLNHDKLTRLSLDYVQCTSHHLYQIIQSDSGKFGCSITHLTIGDLRMPGGDESWSERNYHEVMILLAICLKSLTTLDIFCSSEFKLGPLSIALEKCKRLATLRLVYRKPYVNSFSISQSQKSLLTPLKSIEHLKLQFGYLSFDHFEQLVPIIFPNVKYIDVDCDDTDFKAKLKKRFGRCANLQCLDA